MSYKDNCKKENTPWIPPTPQEFTNAVEGKSSEPEESDEDKEIKEMWNKIF